MATVWRMKDRAGLVGASGVRELLRDVLAASLSPVHLVGHSYGGKVMLSAVAAGALSRPVTSVLLLQPAMSHLCFAVDADGEGHPGGYRVALGRVRQPIITTFSSRDFPLSRVFHLAVRRRMDLGEKRIAAAPPSRFAALGGYGASGLIAGELRTAVVRPEGESYPELAMNGVRFLSLDGSMQITSHGDVSKPSTWWALCEQVRRG
jgi:pimeloyl-ACP methyl ester carboxylesterase